MTNMAEGEVLGPTGNRGISSVTFCAEVTGSLASHTRSANGRLPTKMDATRMRVTHSPQCIGTVRWALSACQLSRAEIRTVMPITPKVAVENPQAGGSPEGSPC